MMSNATWLRQYAAYGGRKGCSHEMADELKEAAAEIEQLRDALKAAGKSLHTIGDAAGLRGTELAHGDQIRGYARNRGTVAYQTLDQLSDKGSHENDI